MNRLHPIPRPATRGALLLLAVLGCTVPSPRPPSPLRLLFETGALRITADPASLAWRVEDPLAAPGEGLLLESGFVVESEPGGLSRAIGRLADGVPQAGTPRQTALGPARAWTAVLADPETRLEIELEVTVLEQRRAVFLSAVLHNASTQTMTIDGITLVDPAATRLAAPGPPDRLRILLAPMTTRDVPRILPASAPLPSSPTMTLAVDPAGGWAFLAGFPAPRTGSGSLSWETGPTGNQPTLRLGVTWRGVSARLGPDERLAADVLLLAWEADPHAAMDAYAEVARENGTSRAPSPAATATRPDAVIAGWGSGLACRGDLSEGSLLRNLAAAARHLKPAGLDLILVEDGYQRSAGDWETHARLPRGHRWITRQIHDRGFRAGLALDPIDVSDLSPLFATHPAWLTREGGGLRQARLDTSNPDARRWLAELAQRITGEWGYDAILANRLSVVTPGASAATEPVALRAIEIRHVLETFRETLGPDRLLLASDVPEPAACGLADAVCAGPGTGADWTRVQEAARALAFVQAFNRRVGRAGANGVSLALPLSEDEALTWGGLLAVTGGMLIVGDDLTTLPPGRVALHQKLLPPVPAGARAVDLFDADPRVEKTETVRPPAIWHCPLLWSGVRADLVLLVNWTDAPARVTVPLARLGLRDGEPRVACDLVEEAIRRPEGRSIGATLRPHASCRLILLPDVGRPQVAGTSRHLVPGVVDLERIGWDDAGRVLSGRSHRLIPAEARVLGTAEPDYAILVHVPEGFRLARAEASSPCLAASAGPDLLRLEFPDLQVDSVTWTLRFTK